MSDTAQIIVAVIGTGITLVGILAGLLLSLFRMLRQDVDSRHKDLRQDLAGLRIDNLYQALFSHKDPAA
ncbi:MAG: hypothetical protein OXU26_18100 [Acidobacteriota bacterium]|nr:hypothetical protein [Acidobacteriota bacterium]